VLTGMTRKEHVNKVLKKTFPCVQNRTELFILRAV
jgi:hypothetical protein